MKELEEGQRTIAEIDYLEDQGREPEAMIKRAELDSLRAYGLGNYCDIMDLVEDGEYGEAFNYIEKVVE